MATTTTKDVVAVWFAAVAAAAIWIASGELSRKPALLEWVATAAYPASIVLLAGSLALTAVRLPFWTNRRGTVSLFKTGIFVFGVVAATYIIAGRSGPVVQHVCFLASISSILGYVLLVVLRGNDKVW